jgi:hypothetical protein
MRRIVDSRTVWSLTAIRHGKQENAESIEEAQFRYGRWPDEVTRSSPKRIPNGLIEILGELEMEEQAMESGFVIYMSVAPSNRESWTQFVSTVTVKNSERSFSFNTRTLYSTVDGEGGTFELVDLYNPCVGGMRMPDKMWMKLDELPMSTLAWAMSSGIMDAEKSRQTDLSQWIGRPKDDTIVPDDIMSLPGPPSRAYTFEDTD